MARSLDASLTDLVTLADVRPEWWSLASCRGTGADRWHVTRTSSRQQLMSDAHQMCSGCPVAGECLRDALGLPRSDRINSGVIRCGVSGARRWREAEALVADLDPQTDHEWSIAAAAVLDGEHRNDRYGRNASLR